MSPLNPEDLQLMAWAVLRYVPSDLTHEQILDEVAELLSEEAEKRGRLYE
jgi:hypothetical protein